MSPYVEITNKTDLSFLQVFGVFFCQDFHQFWGCFGEVSEKFWGGFWTTFCSIFIVFGTFFGKFSGGFRNEQLTTTE